MRYISEQFREKQNQIIRPPLKLYFEVNSTANQAIKADNASGNEIGFDETVAPVIKPSNCVNESYYAVVGDGMPVDDPNRMCAPTYYGGIIEQPDHFVPYGVMPFSDTNVTVLLGNNTYNYKNFIGITFGVTLSFKGGVIPETVVVEKYNTQNSTWETEATIDNSNLKNEVKFRAEDLHDAGKWRRFKLTSSKAGRYQVNWIKWLGENDSVVFENNFISSVMIDEETDLTSQTLPSYEMTVTCLDVNGEYSPESSHWDNDFYDGSDCYFKCGFDMGGVAEYIPILFAELKDQPTYSQGKITFKVALDFSVRNLYKGSIFPSLINKNLEPGDIVDNRLFKDIARQIFTTYDVFHGEVDERGSECNYYGVFESNEIRQLVANAMGCFIAAGVTSVDLYNTNDIQYKTFDNTYLTRYEQAKNELVNTPKADEIIVTRNEYTLSDETYEAEAIEAVADVLYDKAVKFLLPFWEFGKVEIVDAQSTVPDAVINISSSIKPTEYLNSEGMIEVTLNFNSDRTTTIQPIVRFYKVIRTEYKETNTVVSGREPYYNDNILVANGYNAGKVKRVAQFVSDVSNQYEVDVIQDFSREVGDVIRLETQKNVFKTCVITGLKLNLPGSKGHITCRKIFSPMDSAYIATGANGEKVCVADNDDVYNYIITASEHDACILGILSFELPGVTPWSQYFLIGATEMKRAKNGQTPTAYTRTVEITDDNGHIWTVYRVNSGYVTPQVPVLDLGVATSLEGLNNSSAYGSMRLIIELYKEQKMTSPVNYNNSYVVH